MKVMIVDEDKFSAENLINLIGNIDENAEVCVFTEPLLAEEYLSEHDMDVVFMETETCGMSGILLAYRMGKIQEYLNIIFVTSSDQYAFKAYQVHASGYLLKPVTMEGLAGEISFLRFQQKRPNRKKISITTFGNFEIFVKGKNIVFKRQKSKEILAYLVDCRGSSATMSEIAAILWEDREYNRSLQKQMQIYIADMMNALKSAGASEIIVRNYNSISVDCSKVDCDYYNFLSNDKDAIRSFPGEYMKQYSWAEVTAGFLEQKVYDVCK